MSTSTIDVGTGLNSKIIEKGIYGRIASIKIHNNNYKNQKNDYFSSNEFLNGDDNKDNKTMIRKYVQLKLPNNNKFPLIDVDYSKVGLINVAKFNTFEAEKQSLKKENPSDDFIYYTIFFNYGDYKVNDNAKVIVGENGPIFIPPTPTPTPPSTNNSNNSKDEVNLPLVIGVSVGGFVLLAIIVYYFMGKGRGRGRGKGKKSSAKSNNVSNKKGGYRKAGRGKSK